MARPTKEQRLSDVHANARAEFDTIWSANREERLQAVQDRRFYSIAGAQWEGTLGEQFANKPRFEVNKVHLSVMRIINEYRNNRITVDFVAKDGSEDALADVCDGLYRADEEKSVADEAYDNAFEEAVGGGYGAFRFRCDYEDDEDEDDDRQRILIEPIFDADTSVFWDINAKRQDKSDAKVCYVLTAMARQAYVDEWGDDPSSWPKDINEGIFDWCTPDVVYVAEVFKVEETRQTVRVFRSLAGVEEKYTDEDFREDENLEDELAALGWTEIRSKRVKRRKVRKYIMSGAKVLEDCGYIAGPNIPVVPVYGKRWFVDNIERCMGHVRLAKDAQRLKNMQYSKLGEISAQSTIEKPIFLPEQVAGHELLWGEDNVKNYPYMLVNPIEDAQGNSVASGPVGYTKPPAIPPALAALLQLTEQDIQDVLGNQQAGEEMQPQMSGRAVELIQNRLDMQSFIYMSNMAKAVKRAGEIWLGIAREVYVEPGRKMKSIGLQGEIEPVELLREVLNSDGMIETENDLTRATFDVNVEVGPSSSSKRSATVRALTGMLQLAPDPETQTVLSSMAMMNMEGEGISEVRAWFRKRLLRMGAIEPTDAEAEELVAEQQNVQPDAQQLYLAAEAEKAQADALKARADTEHTLARVEETKAKTIETLAGVETDQRRAAVQTAKDLQAITQGRQGQPARP